MTELAAVAAVGLACFRVVMSADDRQAGRSPILSRVPLEAAALRGQVCGAFSCADTSLPQEFVQETPATPALKARYGSAVYTRGNAPGQGLTNEGERHLRAGSLHLR
jgi:hypothetical protein